ncbi:MAG: DUF2924 domain-containing protein [Candidatus Omnitrophota bacterium]
MKENISGQIEALKTIETTQLLALFRQHFGDKSAPGNRSFLIRQLAYRIQEQAAGGISPALKHNIQKLVQSYDPINKRTFKTRGGNLSTTTGRDPRLPMPGSLVTKLYKGDRIEVKVLESGFEYKEAAYKNLSAVAKAVTGSHWNGFGFFGLAKNGKN